MSEIKPFTIAVPETAIRTLHAKLDLATFPEEASFLEDWGSGVPLGEIKRLARYWRDGFNWREQEARLNELAHFTTDVSIEGFGDINVHFVHAKSTRPGSIPLLFCHGWPGSFLEAIKIIPLLTEPRDEKDPSFHVVAPSLPNFGFSQIVSKPGFSGPQYAESMHKIMLKLGYNQYVTQGGDWGFLITRLMAIQYPAHCLATHINTVISSRPTLKTPLQYLLHAILPYSKEEKAGLARTAQFQVTGTGYSTEQGTKPSTLGLSLADSPLGLLAWIYEKLHDWSDAYPWTDDEVLTWISIYHYFPRELLVLPLRWGRTLGPVVFEARHEAGGHFAAYERPEELAGDVKRMFGRERGGAKEVTRTFAVMTEARL
ncbi:unnamed protein product [Clonostachys rosea f. rosea IK726]|uniref:Epoxide hydrolase N-terminal domain-containing protein n=2 Tax=Bionectria ochroleuca TaxID=29856 RepID=A0A0B7JS36_BIOOC|nr:unnamed protein product [Clonostachys rosea f. rosea IK726]